MLNKKEENIKKKILIETNQEKLIKIYKKENITMNIINDKEIQEHVAKYITIEKPKDAGHIYLRKIENSTKEHIKYVDKTIENSTF